MAPSGCPGKRRERARHTRDCSARAHSKHPHRLRQDQTSGAPRLSVRAIAQTFKDSASLLARTLLLPAAGGTEVWSLNLRKEKFVMKKMLALLLGLMFAATTVTMIACGGDDDDSAAADDDDDSAAE